RSPLTPARGRGFDCGLKVEWSWRIELAAGQVLRATPCVCPSWAGTKGGSSPPCDETMKEESTTRSQLREGDRAWESRLWKSHQAMNKNLLRGRRDQVSWHNTAKPRVSVPEVKGVLGWRRFPLLCGETSSAGGSPPGSSAACGNARRDRRGVSR